jgi:hypothetical protein
VFYGVVTHRIAHEHEEGALEADFNKKNEG